MCSQRRGSRRNDLGYHDVCSGPLQTHYALKNRSVWLNYEMGSLYSKGAGIDEDIAREMAQRSHCQFEYSRPLQSPDLG